jgi:hypothetical protein
MKKFFLILFIVADVAIMAAAVFVLYVSVAKRFASGTGGAKPGGSPVAALPMPATAPKGKPASPPGALIAPSTPPVLGGVVGRGNAAVEAGTRKILFSYRNPKAKRVAIRADFTGWKAEPMRREANGVWTYRASLSPGEYAYCYTADDKTFKDPANKRTKQIGRTFVSAIVVEPLPSAKPAK